MRISDWSSDVCSSDLLDWHIIWEYRSDLLQGFVLTLQLSLVAIAGASLLGTLVGCLRASGGFLARRLTALYVELLRNIPIVVKLFLEIGRASCRDRVCQYG